jgi:hypothetical protein
MATTTTTQERWMIPADAIRPALLRFVNEHDAGSKPGSAAEQSVFLSGRRILQERTGMDAAWLRRILNGRCEDVTFTVADRLVTHGLRNPFLWLTDPDLAPHYPSCEDVTA